MAYFHFDYLLSNYFKAPVYEMGSVLLLGHLWIDLTKFERDPFSLSSCPGKHPLFLVGRGPLRPRSPSHTRCSLWWGRGQITPSDHHIWKKALVIAHPQRAGLGFWQCFWIFLQIFFFFKEWHGMAAEKYDMGDSKRADQRKFYQENSDPQL